MIEVVQSKRQHCGPMARRMRQSERDALVHAGVDPHRELVRVFERSSFRRSVFMNGELAAMGGVIGPAIAPHGYVWLALAEGFSTSRRVLVAREAVRWVRRLRKTRTALIAICLLEDAPSWRFLQFLGFESEQEFGPGHATLVHRR